MRGFHVPWADEVEYLGRGKYTATLYVKYRFYLNVKIEMEPV